MHTNATFNELLDAVERLSPDEQADLVDVISRRLADLARQKVVDDVREARQEFDAGAATPSSVDELMREIES